MMHLTETDRMHVLRKLAAHRLLARALRTDDQGPALFALAKRALENMEKGHGQTAFVEGWKDLMGLDRHALARRIVEHDQQITSLRDSSPFMDVYGFDVGRHMRIVFLEEETGRRMWRLAKRLVRIGTQSQAPEIEDASFGQSPSP